MTEQDRADLIAICETLFWGPRPIPHEIEEAYQRIRGRFDLVKVFEEYKESAVEAMKAVVWSDQNKP